jgi:hypothetical protein
VTVDPAVGRLLLDVGDTDGGSATAVLVYHDGGFTPLPILANWSARNGGLVEPEAGIVQVPLLAPGPYRACRLLGPHEYSSFMAGLLPSSRCDAGTLAPGGELRLVVPTGPAAGSGGEGSR